MPGDLRGARGLQPVGLVKSRHLKTHLPALVSLRRMEREWRGQLCDEPARMGEWKAEPGVHQGLHGSASEEGTAAPRDEPSPPTCGDCPQDEAAGGTEGELVDRTLEKPHLRCAGSGSRFSGSAPLWALGGHGGLSSAPHLRTRLLGPRGGLRLLSLKVRSALPSHFLEPSVLFDPCLAVKAASIHK